jgi:hypothetical protein
LVVAWLAGSGLAGGLGVCHSVFFFVFVFLLLRVSVFLCFGGCCTAAAALLLQPVAC